LAIKALVLDWDGTLIDSFRGSRWTAAAKTFFFRRLKSLYFLVDLAEMLFRPGPLHREAMALILAAQQRGILVGIVTDRKTSSFVRSARRAGFGVWLLDFVHARRSRSHQPLLLRAGVSTLSTFRFKGERLALAPLMIYLEAKGIKPDEVLMVGDDERDCEAARECGFNFVKVDRYAPDFGPIYGFLDAKTRT